MARAALLALICLFTACATQNQPGGGLDDQEELPPVPVLIGQEHYTLVADKSEVEPHNALYLFEDRHYDLGLRRDIYADHEEWHWGGWYLISWNTSPVFPLERFRNLGLGSVWTDLHFDAKYSDDGFIATQRIEDGASLWNMDFSGLRAAVEELSFIPYGVVSQAGGSVIAMHLDGTLADGTRFECTQDLYLVRRDGIDAPYFTVYDDKDLPAEPVPVPPLPRWDEPPPWNNEGAGGDVRQLTTDGMTAR